MPTGSSARTYVASFFFRFPAGSFLLRQVQCARVPAQRRYHLDDLLPAVLVGGGLEFVTCQVEQREVDPPRGLLLP